MPTTAAETVARVTPQAAAETTTIDTWFIDESLLVAPSEYAAMERDLRCPDFSTAVVNDDDAEFTAILKMKTDPLTLTPAEAETYATLRGRPPARRVGQPLPLE